MFTTVREILTERHHYAILYLFYSYLSIYVSILLEIHLAMVASRNTHKIRLNVKEPDDPGQDLIPKNLSESGPVTSFLPDATHIPAYH